MAALAASEGGHLGRHTGDRFLPARFGGQIGDWPSPAAELSPIPIPSSQPATPPWPQGPPRLPARPYIHIMNTHGSSAATAGQGSRPAIYLPMQNVANSRSSTRSWSIRPAISPQAASAPRISLAINSLAPWAASRARALARHWSPSSSACA